MLLHEAVHVVGDPESLSDVEEQTRAHPLPEQRVQEVYGVSVRMQVAVRPHSKADMRLLRALPAHHHMRAVEGGWRDRGDVAIQTPGQREPGTHQLHDLILVQRAPGADHYIRQPGMR